VIKQDYFDGTFKGLLHLTTQRKIVHDYSIDPLIGVEISALCFDAHENL
jgi:hypothetical protein